MPVDWKAKDSFTRLLAAIMAAHDLKLDYRRIATFYGQGATYDSIEGRFRIVRKEAIALKADMDAAGVTDTPRGRPKPGGVARDYHHQGTANLSRKRSATTSNNSQRVDHGRVVKTPTRKPPRRPGPGSSAASAISLDVEEDRSDETMGTKIKSEHDQDADGESDAHAYSFEDDGYSTGNGLLDSGFGGWTGYGSDDFPEAV